MGELAAVLQIIVGDDVVFNCIHGSISNEPPPAASPLALLQAPAVKGLVLQPHQLFSAFTLPSDSTKCSAPDSAGKKLVLPTNRLKCTCITDKFGLLFSARAPPAPAVVELFKKVFLFIATGNVVPAGCDPCPVI